MKRRRILALAVLLRCECRSEAINRWTQTQCSARKAPLAPGSKWIDYDHGGGWVQVGDDGKAHPISDPGGRVSPSLESKSEQNERNR